MNEIPRKMRLDLASPAELAIYNAMQEIEKLPPDERLTNAVIKLAEAKSLVSDFIDETEHEFKKLNDNIIEELDDKNRR